MPSSPCGWRGRVEPPTVTRSPQELRCGTQAGTARGGRPSGGFDGLSSRSWQHGSSAGKAAAFLTEKPADDGKSEQVMFREDA